MKSIVNIIEVILGTYLFIYIFIINNDYINIKSVVLKHISMFLGKNRRESDIKAFIIFFILPLIISILLGLENIIGIKFYDNILIVLTILVAVFLTFISILTSKSFKNKNDKQKTIINYVFVNIYFLIILTFVLIIICVLKTSIVYSNLNLFEMLPSSFVKSFSKIANYVLDVSSIYLIIEIFINLLIAIRRIEQIFFITYEDE